MTKDNSLDSMVTFVACTRIADVHVPSQMYSNNIQCN